MTSHAFYPPKPVRLIEPFGVGGGVDVLARAVAASLSRLWGVTVTVENRPGGGSRVAPALVARSPADGCTLLVNTSAQAYSAALARGLAYDPLKDFIPVAPLTRQAYVLVAGRQTGITSISELTALAKARPGELTFGSAGIGTGTHLGVEELNLEARITTTHMPPPPGDAITDTIARTVAGLTAYMLAPIPSVLPALRSGELVALGVSTEQRSRLLPEAPTISEAGVPGFDFPIWYGVWAPAGAPPSLVDALAKDIAQSLAEPDLREWFAEHAAEPMGTTQPEFARFVLSERDRAARIMSAARAKLR